jgi:hypothetical protein
MKLLVVALLATLGMTYTVVSQDHLTPEEGVLAGGQEYNRMIREVFGEIYHSDIVLKVVFLPAFQPEEIAGIRKTETGFESFASRPSSHIWETYGIYQAEKQNRGAAIDPNSPLAEMKRKFPSDFHDIAIQIQTRQISAQMTERVRRVWQDMLLAAKHPKVGALGTDGETFHFSMWVYQHGMLSGQVFSPQRGRTLALTRLAEALAEYAEGKGDEKKLSDLLKPLERSKRGGKVGVSP